MEEACQDLKAQAGMAYVTSHIPWRKLIYVVSVTAVMGVGEEEEHIEEVLILPALSSKKDRFIGKNVCGQSNVFMGYVLKPFVLLC